MELKKVKINGKWGLLSEDGREVIYPQYDWISDFKDGMATVGLNNRIGLISEQGEVIVSPKYYIFIGEFRDGFANVRSVIEGKYGSIGIINEKGEEIIPCEYSCIGDLEYGFRKISLDRRFKYTCGLINAQGKEIISLSGGNKIYVISDKLIILKKYNNEWTMINEKGDEVGFRRYNYIGKINDNLLYVDYGNRYGFINNIGEEIISPKYTSLNYHINVEKIHYIIVEIFNKYGLVDDKGKECIVPKYDKIESCYNELFLFIELKGKVGLINAKGDEIVFPKYDKIWDLKNGFFKVLLKGKYGFINQQGEEIIPPKYDEVHDFEDGLARVKIEDKIGYINEEFKEVISVKYDRSRAVIDEIVMLVDKEKRQGIINKKGKIIVPFGKYDYIDLFHKGAAKVYLNGKYGFINQDGEEILTPIIEV